jgi:DNA-binding IclR family transcriptional regulator
MHGRFGWRISDLCEASQLDLSTTHRLLQGMIRTGLAMQIPGRRHYALGPLAFELGLAAGTRHDVGRASGERLRAAARQLGGTLYLMGRSGKESVCLNRADGSQAPSSFLLEPGGRRPLLQTAGGIAILLKLPQAEQAQIITANRTLLARRDPLLLAGIERMLARSLAQGIALNVGDVVTGIQACATAVVHGREGVLGSIAFAEAGRPWSTRRLDNIRQLMDGLALQVLGDWTELRMNPNTGAEQAAR